MVRSIFGGGRSVLIVGLVLFSLTQSFRGKLEESNKTLSTSLTYVCMFLAPSYNPLRDRLYETTDVPNAILIKSR